MRIILVGAGISNAITSLLLRRQFGSKLKIIVYDKGQNIGGRMSTSYDRPENPHCSVDIGAQYLTLTKSDNITKKFFQELINDNVIELLDKKNTIGIRDHPDKIDYTAPRGMSSIVRYYFEQAVAEINLSKQIENIDFNSTNTKFSISTTNEQLDESEFVIVTIPVPQILNDLKGSISDLIDKNEEIKNNLKQVKYSTRFAVGFFYPLSIKNLHLPWRIYYVDKTKNDCLRFLAVDNEKRNQNQPPYSLLAHTNVEFGEKFKEENKNIIGEQIKEQIFQFLPDLSNEISNIKYHKWKYSQVIQSYPDKPSFIVLNEKPLLILTGDGFANDSTFEGCIHASIKTFEHICQLVY